MAMRKRTTKKNGNYGRTTSTFSATRGITRSSSCKPPGAFTRKTVSHNNGKMRTTYTTNSNGWTRSTSKTVTLVSKPKPTKKSSSKKSFGYRVSGMTGEWTIGDSFNAILFLAIIISCVAYNLATPATKDIFLYAFYGLLVVLVIRFPILLILFILYIASIIYLFG